MWRRRSFSLGALVLAVLVGSLLLASESSVAGAQSSEVQAAVETDPVPSGGDAADDPAIWIHPGDPSLSTVIGTDKEGGLAVYDLDGNELQYIPGFRPNNVDVIHDFPLGGESVDLVLSSDRDDDVITIHRVEVATRQLVEVGPSVETDMSVYGICTYRSQSGYYVYVTPEEDGMVRQWELTDNGSGGVGSSLVREFPMDSVAEGCVADDELGYLYVAQEDVGIWKYGAEPDAGSTRASVDTLGSRLEDDIEGLTIYYGPDQTGYLMASSQGSDEFVVYDRQDDNPYITSFTVAGSTAIDEVTNTDGIDISSVPLSPTFPRGLFVAQDGENDSGNQNFKLVSWELVARSVSPTLSDEAGPDPRGELVAPIDFTPPEPERDWAVAGSRASADGDEDLVFEAGRQVTLRFEGLELAPGSVIRSAYIQFSALAEGEETVMLTLRARTEDGTATEMAATWAPAPWEEGARGAYQRTVDLSAIIREVVAGGDWQPGDALIVEIEASGEGSRAAVSSDGDGADLRLEHTADA